jgi:hypothetical protein
VKSQAFLRPIGNFMLGGNSLGELWVIGGGQRQKNGAINLTVTINELSECTWKAQPPGCAHDAHG